MKRGYSRPSLQRAVTRVRTIPRHETHKQQEHTDSTRDRTPFVIAFNPALYKVSSVLKKHRNFLQSSQLQRHLLCAACYCLQTSRKPS